MIKTGENYFCDQSLKLQTDHVYINKYVETLEFTKMLSTETTTAQNFRILSPSFGQLEQVTVFLLHVPVCDILTK
jgi:hypothetical protein